MSGAGGTMMAVTGEQLREQHETHGILRWIVHRCGFCTYPCGYSFNGAEVVYDSGCDCVSYSGIQPRDWRDVADHCNMQTTPSVIAEYRAFWRLPDVEVEA